MTGFFYLITIVAAIIAQGVIAERIVNSSSASLTAANISAHAKLFRFGCTAYMIEMVAQVVMTMLFYELLRPVNRTASLIAAVAVVGGIGWLTFLWPPLGYRLNMYIAAIALLGSLATIVWLLLYGVNEERWLAQARVPEESL